MIRLRLTELLADLSFRQGRRIEWREVAAETGIHRTPCPEYWSTGSPREPVDLKMATIAATF